MFFSNLKDNTHRVKEDDNNVEHTHANMIQMNHITTAEKKKVK